MRTLSELEIARNLSVSPGARRFYLGTAMPSGASLVLTTSFDRRCRPLHPHRGLWLLWDHPEQPSFPCGLHIAAVDRPGIHRRAGLYDLQAADLQS
jgi:hypothetical protein